MSSFSIHVECTNFRKNIQNKLNLIRAIKEHSRCEMEILEMSKKGKYSIHKFVMSRTDVRRLAVTSKSSWHQIESFSHSEAGTPYQRQLWTRISSEFLWQTNSVLMHLKSCRRTSSPDLSRHSSMSRMENIFAHIKYSLKTMFFVPCWEKLASSVSSVEHLNDQTQTFSLARHSRPCGGGRWGLNVFSSALSTEK